MTYDFHPDARFEYRQAAAFYEDRHPGLGAAFTLEVEAAIERYVTRRTAGELSSTMFADV